MLNRITGIISDMLKWAIWTAFLAAVAGAAVTLAYSAILTCWRLAGMMWREFFSSPWL